MAINFVVLHELFVCKRDLPERAKYAKEKSDLIKEVKNISAKAKH